MTYTLAGMVLQENSHSVVALSSCPTLNEMAILTATMRMEVGLQSHMIPTTTASNTKAILGPPDPLSHMHGWPGRVMEAHAQLGRSCTGRTGPRSFQHLQQRCARHRRG